MSCKRSLSILTLAIAAALPLALPAAAFAQARAATSIASMGVEQVKRLSPGTVLAFSLNGTPGADVSLQIAGATATVPMSEVRPGVYEGSYTIAQRDRLTSASRVTAQVVKDGQTASATLARSLQAGARDPVPVLAAAQITGFDVTAPERLRGGDELGFSLTGTPGAKARVAVQGIDRSIPLSEASPGVYEGVYVMRRNDRLRGDLVVDGYLLSHQRETRQRFTRAQVGDANSAYRRDNSQARPQAVAACASCGSVVAVNLVETQSDAPNIIGTIAGGVLGGVLGHQVGGGTGKDLATIAGAVGGAYAGNRVENNIGKSKVYRVMVRLEGGATQSFDYAADPAMKVGTAVRVDNGALVRL